MCIRTCFQHMSITPKELWWATWKAFESIYKIQSTRQIPNEMGRLAYTIIDLIISNIVLFLLFKTLFCYGVLRMSNCLSISFSMQNALNWFTRYSYSLLVLNVFIILFFWFSTKFTYDLKQFSASDLWYIGKT